MRKGHTLWEIMVVLALVGVLTAVGGARVPQWLDRIAVKRAAGDLAAFYQVARFRAVLRSRRVRIELRPDVLRAVYDGVSDSQLVSIPGPRRYGVQMAVSRPMIGIHPNGVGYGASNTKVVLRRGLAAESLTTSRVGRIKRWR